VSASSGFVLEWTVGEYIVESITSRSVLLTQGFHQSFLQVQKLTAGKEESLLENLVHVYPNPSSRYVNILLKKPSETPLFLSLLDVTGKAVITERLRSNSVAARLNVGPLSQGTYLLKIANANGIVQGSYKIIKAQ